MGDVDQAITDYDRAITLNPQSAPYYYGRGHAYFTGRDFDDAVADLNQAIALDPEYAEAHALRGMALAEIGEQEMAVLDIEQALHLGLEPDLRRVVEGLLEEWKQ
jgi:tetratricopeptide (TPR) repeat protein